MEQEQDFYEFMAINGIATEDELDLVTNCYGFTMDALSRVLYYRTGYETMEQYLGIDEDEEDEDDDE